jgi:hypothetical protein
VTGSEHTSSHKLSHSGRPARQRGILAAAFPERKISIARNRSAEPPASYIVALMVDWYRIIIVLGVAFSLGLVSAAAVATDQLGPKGVTKVLRSPLPYWKVGDIDRDLSKLCSLGQFNQRVPFKFSGQFVGGTGPYMLGGTKGTGLNLFDPQGKRDEAYDYWFLRDRTSACIVFKSLVDKTGTPLEGGGVVPRQ